MDSTGTSRRIDLKGIARVIVATGGLVAAVGALWTSRDAKSRSDSASAQSANASKQSASASKQSASASSDASRTYEVLVSEIKDLTERVRVLETTGVKPDVPRKEARASDELRARSPKLLPAALKDLPRASPFEDETDRTGGDFSAFDLGDPDPARCRQACILDPKCRAFTYARPGFANGRNSPARCFLKASINAPVRKECCISGIVDRRT
jgi:PAN domain